jgi:hypothetical protein
MFVIKYFDSKQESDFIYDVVENYDTLVIYFNKLMERNPSLKMIQPIPQNPRIGYIIPILQNNGIEYYIERYEFVTEPSPW